MSTTLLAAPSSPVAAEADHRRRRAAWRPLAAAVVGGAVLVTTGFGAWASLSATATSVDPQTVTTGTLKLVMAANGNGVGATQAVRDLAPGDTAHRYVTLTNSGTLDATGLTAKVTGTGSQVLLADGVAPATSKGLRVSVASCTVAWDAATGGCAGTVTPLLAATALPAAGTDAALPVGAVLAGGQHHLRLTASLPDQNENTLNGVLPSGTVQGATAQLTWSFTEQQRAAQTTSS